MKTIFLLIVLVAAISLGCLADAFTLPIYAVAVSNKSLSKLAIPANRQKLVKRQFSSPDRSIEIDDDRELIKRLNAEVMAESGVELEQLINPSKVVNLERDIIKLNKQLNVDISLSEADRENIESVIAKKQTTLAVEKRSVMRRWLKNLFVVQSVLATAISLAMAYDAVPNTHLPLSAQVLGFWMWWLFIIPSLR
jgi:hypothetical protein